MIRALPSSFLGLLFLAATGPAQDAKLLKAMDAWLDAYRKGRIDLAADEDVAKKSIPGRAGVLPKGVVGRLTHRRELELMLEQAKAFGDPETALAVLRFAAVGLDGGNYDPRMAPHLVREAGERALEALPGNAVRAVVEQVAREGHGGDRTMAVALQAAALRALGNAARDGDQRLLETQLESAHDPIRLAAADALRRLGAATALPPLTTALGREQSARPLAALVEAIDSIVVRHRADLPAPTIAAAAAAAIGVLGRTNWRVDSTIIDLLEHTRSEAAVPALIGVLERFERERDAIRAGRLSGLLRARAHEALIALTGAHFPAEEPARWRDWWSTAASGFAVVERPTTPRAEQRTVSGFFGMPVRGTRVVFIVDVSGSMLATMPVDVTASAPDKLPTRLDVARNEVWNAVQHIESDGAFNLVTFSEQATPWRKEPVEASEANKKRFRKHLDTLKGETSTNLWAGLQAALRVESFAYGAEGGADIDEIFLLSDGAPTVGEVVDPREILRLIGELNRFARIRINTVFIEGEKSFMDPAAVKKGEGIGPDELMAELAKQSGGSYVRR
jgi:Mg-chelatase subunit ChlD